MHRQAGPWQVVLVRVGPAATPDPVSNQLSNNGH
jgi:hypothetical protein